MTEVHTNGNGHGHYAPLPIVTQIPGSIVKAIVAVQGAIAGVTKDGKNQHGNYAYASADAIYAMVTHKMADAGLVIICLEEHAPEIVKVEKEGKTTQWGRFTFSFILATEQATWSDVGSRRSLFTPITGPQTFMAAQSYAEKTYLKSLFKIPTGDKFELDGLPQDIDPEQERPKRKSSRQAKMDGTNEVFNALDAELNNADGPVELRGIWSKNAKTLSELPARWYGLLAETYTVKMGEHDIVVEVEDQQTFRAQL